MPNLDLKALSQITPQDISEYLKKISPKTWAKIAGVAGGTGLLIVFFVIPAWVTRLQVKNEVTKIEGQMLTTQNLLRKQGELNRNKEKFVKVGEEVKKRLYQPGEASLLLGVIARLAEESKVSVVASNPKKFEGKFPPPFDTQYEANAYEFTVEGGYHDLAAFISKIENNEKILRIQSYNIRPQEKTADRHLAEINLTAVSTKGSKP